MNLLIPLVLAMVLHELAHGLVALRYGDDSARLAGRLTLNPIPHMEVFGSLLLPAISYALTAGMTVIGRAKPVPVAWHRLDDPLRSMVKVALAGPACNALQALLWLLALPHPMAVHGVATNAILCAANLMPLGNQDGAVALRAWKAIKRTRP